MIDNNTQLTFTNPTGFSNNTTVNSTGGKLDIRSGQVIETETNYVIPSSGNLYMSFGTLYKIAKGNGTSAGAYGDPIPRLNATSFPYILTGGTIELSGGTASNYFQVLRADDANYNYYNVKFSGANTLGTDYKAFTSATYIDNSLIITGTAIVDCYYSRSNRFACKRRRRYYYGWRQIKNV